MSADTPTQLHPGLNGSGYLPDPSLPVAQELQSIDGIYQRVLSLDKTYDVTLPEGFSTPKELRPGEGYLIYMNQDATLTYPAGGGAGMQESRSPERSEGRGRRDQRSQGAEARGCAVQPTPYATLVYGSVLVNGDPASVGTRVEALTPRGEVAGCFVVERPGQYGLMHVYGADLTANPSIPGFLNGEPLHFRVNGMEVSPSETLAWQDDKAPHRADLTASTAWPSQAYLPLVEQRGP